MSAENGFSFSEMETAFNSNEAPPVVQAAETAPTTVAPTEAATPEVQTTTPDPTQTTPAPEQIPEPPDNKAFAAMRVENARIKADLEKVLRESGLGTDVESAIKAIDAKAFEEEAKKLSASPEMLAKLTQQEQAIASLVRAQQESNLVNAFSVVQTQFGIDQAKVYEFANSLKSAGIDVMNNLQHLTTLYQGMHYEELAKAQVDKAVQEATARFGKAEEQGSTPSASVGTGAPSKDKPITTQAEFEALLNGTS